MICLSHFVDVYPTFDFFKIEHRRCCCFWCGTDCCSGGFARYQRLQFVMFADKIHAHTHTPIQALTKSQKPIKYKIETTTWQGSAFNSLPRCIVICCRWWLFLLLSASYFIICFFFLAFSFWNFAHSKRKRLIYMYISMSMRECVYSIIESCRESFVLCKFVRISASSLAYFLAWLLCCGIKKCTVYIHHAYCKHIRRCICNACWLRIYACWCWVKMRF